LTLRDIAVAFGFEVDKKSEQQAEKSIKDISNMAKNLLSSIGVVFSVKGLSELAQAAADAEALKSQFTQVFGEMEEEAAKSLQSISNETGALENRMKGSFTQIAAFAKTTGADQATALEISERAMIAVADSAAFYDRSLEDVTQSLRSFLKGNFEQDAALGLSATETTRNAAANELYGKSFKDLSEQQKQFTLLKMVEDANKLSGAIGQAARESDTWTNRLGNMKQAIQDFKAETGGTFLKPAIQILKLFTKGIQYATKAIRAYAGENGFLRREVERVKALFSRFQPVVDRVSQTITKGLTKGREVIGKLTEKLGGTDNVLRILTIAVGAFAAVLIGPKLIGAITMVAKMLRMAFTVNPKMLAFIAIITVIILLVEDLINFMNGNDSLIGSLFEKAGIDGEAFRQTIQGLVDKFMEFLPVIIELGKTLGQQLLDIILQLIPYLLQIIQMILPVIIELIVKLLPVALKIIEKILPVLLKLIMSILPIVMKIIDVVLPLLISLLDAILPIIDPIISLVANLVETLLPVVVSLLESILPILKPLLGVLEPIANVLGIIIEALGKVVGMAAEGLQWLIELIFGGEADTSKVKKIKGHAEGTEFTEDTFIAGEEGPELITGQRGKKVYNAVETGKIFGNIANMISALGKANRVSPRTASVVSGDTVSKSVVQNVEINNSYTGGSVETQKNVSKAMKKSAVDASTQMARALDYARG